MFCGVEDFIVERRNQQLDIVKGFAIVLVVLGHAIQYTYRDFDNLFVFRLIYSFHMPLFMFVSGMLVQFNRNKVIDLYWLKKGL